ncbi:hypothetical protein, partial [uncultured Empedobacter sp.]|uniref:hypothetical protein n=1 Tax=uncultured Empedobacter sp. TaxID=410844 RepID=UPI0025DE5660
IYGFGQIIFYYILSKLENKLDSFIIELEKLENNGNIIREKHRIIFKFQSIFQYWISSIVSDNEMNMLIHLFTKTNSSIISINIDGHIDIDYSQIMNIKKYISDYDFNKVK